MNAAVSRDSGLEWLETDGLGGFASGSAALARTRRYHALLIRAVTPSQRFVLVNGFDAFVTTPDGRFAISAQRYEPGVTAPDGLARLEEFRTDPWPTWNFRLPCGRAVRQEIFTPHGRCATVVAFRLEGSAAGCSIEIRPFLSGRDPHALQKENNAFNFDAARAGRVLIWSAYDGVPAVSLNTNAAYRPDPHWYRNFRYEAERDRGLDYTEDLATPGLFTWDFAAGPEAVMVFASTTPAEDYHGFYLDRAVEVAAHYRALEKRRRESFTDPLHRAAADYLVRRGRGHTIIAGYPWFTDWGRDTFIALRGLCLATGQLEQARSILLEWAGAVSEGMLPNFFPEGGREPEYNSVDASLWFVVAAHDYLTEAEQRGQRPSEQDRTRLAQAIQAILTGYSRGTRFGIRADADGLLFAGQAGVQLTWMDAKVGDHVITPRMGKPVEIQALWINALRIGATLDPKWKAPADLAQRTFGEKFWNAANDCLFDVVDAEFAPGRYDPSVRPNQIFAVGGLPFQVLTGSRARSVVRAVEASLLTPLGLRSLAPDDSAFIPHYRGGPWERDSAYHQGTVWPWLIGPFVEAWLRVNTNSPSSRATAERRFLAPLRTHLSEAGLGHVSEVCDAAAPHVPGGCPFQAWSVGELLRAERLVRSTTPPDAPVPPPPFDSAKPAAKAESVSHPLGSGLRRARATAATILPAMLVPDYYRL